MSTAGHADTPNPLAVLRRYAVTSVDGNPTNYDVALAAVETLVEAARGFGPFGDKAEMRWMSVEDATIEVKARLVAEVCRALAPFVSGKEGGQP